MQVQIFSFGGVSWQVEVSNMILYMIILNWINFDTTNLNWTNFDTKEFTIIITEVIFVEQIIIPILVECFLGKNIGS